MRPVRGAYGATFGRRRSLSVVIVLMFVVFGIGFSTSFWLPLRLGYLLLFGLIAAFAWRLLSLRGVRVTLQRDTERVQAGQSIIEHLEIRNDLRVPKFWLEIEEKSDLPDHQSMHVVSLGGNSRRQWRIETVCHRRGLYTLGPITVRSSDPFELFETEQLFGYERQVLVYPRPLDLPHYTVPPANLPGEGRFRRRTHYVTPNASGLRDYAPGDSVNRIHWPSTLRTGRLLVKTFELDPASQMWIVLDLHQGDHVGSGDEASIEYAVTAAASVARLFLGQSRSVGMMSFGGDLDLVYPDRGNQQLTRILEALALAQPGGDVPLGTLLFQQARRWGRHTTLIVISGSTDSRTLDALRALTQRGVKVAVIALDLESFGGRGGSDAVVMELGAAGVQTNQVRRGDFLPEVLAPRVGGRYAGAEVLA